MTPVALDVPPVTTSPIIKSFWEEIKRREFAFISSTRITAVALDVVPVIVSPFTKAPTVRIKTVSNKISVVPGGLTVTPSGG